MNRADAMWVGLKLLGLYFLATALSELSQLGYYLYELFSATPGSQVLGADYWQRLVVAYLGQISIHFIAAIVFLCLTTPIVSKLTHSSQRSTPPDD